jgi:hypothetical protein
MEPTLEENTLLSNYPNKEELDRFCKGFTANADAYLVATDMQNCHNSYEFMSVYYALYLPGAHCSNKIYSQMLTRLF